MDLRFGRSRLPELLETRHLSQLEFALLLGVSQSFVSQLISGASKFSLIKAVHAAIILRCKVEDLYEWKFE